MNGEADSTEFEREAALSRGEMEDEQSIFERTAEHAEDHLKRASMMWDIIWACEEQLKQVPPDILAVMRLIHDRTVSAYNTATYLVERDINFSAADVQAAWKDGWEALRKPE